jgi:hypothetical protein
LNPQVTEKGEKSLGPKAVRAGAEPNKLAWKAIRELAASRGLGDLAGATHPDLPTGAEKSLAPVTKPRYPDLEIGPSPIHGENVR